MKRALTAFVFILASLATVALAADGGVSDLPAPSPLVAAAAPSLYAWVVAHASQLSVGLAVWVGLASLLSRVWPKPSAPPVTPVYVAHLVLVDLPGVVAAKGQAGKWLGLPITLPFVEPSAPVKAVS